MNSKPIALKDAIDLMKKCLHEQTLTSFKYYLGGLYLEFGELDDNNRGEFAFQIFPSWKFQANYRLKHHSDMEKEEIKSGLTEYIGKKINNWYIIEQTCELYLDFGDVYFTTLTTYNNGSARSFFIRKSNLYENGFIGIYEDGVSFNK